MMLDHRRWCWARITPALLQYISLTGMLMLRSHEGQNVWRCTGDENYVLWWRWVPMSNVWSHRKTPTRCIDEPSGKHHRCIAEYSARHRGIFGDCSALHRLKVNDVLLESGTVGDPSAMRGGGPRVISTATFTFHARVRGSVPGLGGFKETKNVSSPSTCESQYCGEPPWLRSVLGLRPPGPEFGILCLEDSVISIISPSSGGSPGPV